LRACGVGVILTRGTSRKDLGGRDLSPAQILLARGARPQDDFSGELRNFGR
jgi:hypothetical protein